jgi:hypothetical protein
MWNQDGEHYRLVIFGEHVETYTDVEAAADAYADRACAACWQSTHSRAAWKCCAVQTWTRS